MTIRSAIAGTGTAVASILMLATSAVASTTAVDADATDSRESAAKAVVERVFDAPDEKVAFEKLSDQEEGLFWEYVTPVKEEVQSSSLTAARVAALPDQCLTVPGGRRGVNSFGATLWEINHQHGACIRSGRVINASFQQSTVSTPGLGWTGGRLINRDTGVVNGQSRQYVQHEFSLKIAGQSVRNPKPCSRSAMTNTGNVIPSNACNITLG